MLQHVESSLDQAQQEADVDPSPFGIVDAVAAVVENLRLLTIAPLLAAALTAGVAATIAPVSYTSTAYLSLDDDGARQVESLMKTPKILKAALLDTRPSLPPEAPLVAEMSELRGNITLVPTNNQPRKLAKIFELRVSDQDPERARVTNEALIARWLESTRPGPIAKSRIERRIALLAPFTAQRMGSRAATPSPVTVQGARAADLGVSKTRGENETAETKGDAPIIVVTDSPDRVPEQLSRDEKIFDLEDKLLGVTPEVVISAPGPGVSDWNRTLLLIGVAVGTLTGLLLLVAVLVGKMIELSDPITKAKWHRVAEQLPWRRRSSGRGAALGSQRA